MTAASRIIFKSFLDLPPPERRKRLVSYLPKEEAEKLALLSFSHQDPTLGITEGEKLLDTFHYSWFESTLRALAPHDLSLFLSALSAPLQDRLIQDLGCSSELFSLKPQARAFLQKRVFEALTKETFPLLPLECLPQSPLNTLLFLSYPQKLKFIDLLSMHDLALELKLIIKKERFEKLMQILSEDERSYLAPLLKQTEHLSFRSMNLNKWDGNPATLRTLLRQRGINRLSKGMYGADPSLLWYLTRQLDMTSASLFQKLHTPLDNSLDFSRLQEQIINLIEPFREAPSKESPA